MAKKTTDKKSVTDTRLEHQGNVQRVAIETYRWAIEKGCVRKSEDQEIQGYFIVTSGTKRSSKPNWPDAFGEEDTAWGEVYMEMLRLGFPICADQRQGHYIGVDGEQGSKIITTLNNATTRIETLRKMIELVIEGRQWGDVQPWLEKRLPEAMRDKDLMVIMKAFEQLLIGVGYPVQKSIAQYLLEAGSTDKGDAA